jgi:hypothetical protein
VSLRWLLLALLLLAAPLLTGCGGSCLRLSVDRYHIDDGHGGREAYEKAHPPQTKVACTPERLKALQEDIVALNKAFKEFHADTSTFDAAIVEPIFKNATCARLDELATSLRELEARKEIVLNVDVVRRQAEDLKGRVANQTLLDAAQAAENQAERTRLDKMQTALGAEGQAEVSGTFARIEASQAVTLKKDSGFGVARRHVTVQDMGDPFIAYIAQNPKNWQPIPNAASVSGDGDTEFVLVFEDGLDAHWSSISVDPEKMIRARLRLGRSVGKAIAAASGVVAGALGVPVPKADGNATEDVDYATLVAQGEELELRNERTRRQLRELARFAAGSSKDFDKLSVTQREALRTELFRRAGAITAPPSTAHAKGDGQ